MQDAMREEKPAPVEQATDEELFEVLIAISVVAKQLATIRRHPGRADI